MPTRTGGFPDERKDWNALVQVIGLGESGHHEFRRRGPTGSARLPLEPADAHRHEHE